MPGMGSDNQNNVATFTKRGPPHIINPLPRNLLNMTIPTLNRDDPSHTVFLPVGQKIICFAFLHPLLPLRWTSPFTKIVNYSYTHSFYYAFSLAFFSSSLQQDAHIADIGEQLHEGSEIGVTTSKRLRDLLLAQQFAQHSCAPHGQLPGGVEHFWQLTPHII